MKRLDHFVAYKGKFYARKFDSETNQKVHSLSNICESDFLSDPENEKSLFTVDWQMEDIGNQMDNSVVDLYMRRLDIKRSGQDSATKKSFLYISDW